MEFRGQTEVWKTIFQNSGWLLFDKLLRLFIGLTISAWIARDLGPDQFGNLAYIIAIIAIFQSVTTLGLDNILVRDMARNHNGSGQLLATVTLLRFITGLVSWIIILTLMILINGFQSVPVPLTFLVGGVLVFQAGDTVDLWFQSQSRNKLTVLVRLIAYLIANTTKVLLLISHKSLYYFAAVVSLEGFISCVGFFIIYRRHPCPDSWSVSLTITRRLLKEGFPYALSSIAILIYMRIDQIMIKEILGEQELGIYAALLPIATVWQFIPMMLMTVLAPFISRAKTSGDIVYWEMLRKIFRVYALLGWGASILALVIASNFVSILYGDSYKDGVPTLIVYSFTNIIINMGVAQNLWIFNEKKSKIHLYKTCIGLLICIVGNYILLPLLGIIGAAITALITQFISAILSNFIYSRKILKLQINSSSLFWVYGLIFNKK